MAGMILLELTQADVWEPIFLAKLDYSMKINKKFPCLINITNMIHPLITKLRKQSSRIRVSRRSQEAIPANMEDSCIVVLRANIHARLSI